MSSIVARVRESSGDYAAVFEFPITVLLKIYFLQQCILAHFLKRRFTVFLQSSDIQYFIFSDKYHTSYKYLVINILYFSYFILRRSANFQKLFVSVIT